METSDHAGYIYDSWLASACMPSSTVLLLLQHYNDAATVYEAVQHHDTDLADLVPSRFCRILQNNSSDHYLTAMKKKMAQYSIGVIRIHDDLYPDQLMDISDPPALMFYRGDPKCLKNRILSMIGSRSASYSGQKATAKLAEELSRKGISVVSGLACGIDASAHRGCIDGGSPTIAVTGCGLDRIYPRDNMPLHDRILETGGLVLSEYAPGEQPSGWHFPVRNRIISGISAALILMEARIRSGSMTTVHHALNQGKDVFVYPGDPSSEQFEGNHQLLREGGIYFTSADDILEDMGWLDNIPAVRHNIDCPTAEIPLSQDEKMIAEALKPGSLSFEELLKYTGIKPSSMLSSLSMLQIKGIIDALPGKRYQIKH